MQNNASFQMPVDDVLPAMAFPELGQDGVLLTGIVEDGALATGAVVQIVGGDGNVLAAGKVLAILDQDAMLAGASQPLPSAPPPYEIGLLLGDASLAEQLPAGRCTVVAAQ